MISVRKHFANTKTKSTEITWSRRLSPASIKEQLTPMFAELALALSRKPELAQRLMHLERSFIDSPTVGAFLRKEGVIKETSKSSRRRFGEFMILATGIVLGAILIYFVKSVIGE